MKIYTKTGDKGQTGLIGCREVWKDDTRIEAYGTVDELNSAIGLSAGFIHHSTMSPGTRKKCDNILKKIQNELFNLGCELATPKDKLGKNLPKITDQHVKDLEALIDCLQEELPPLRKFILPGGDPISGMFHLARSICRRAERRCVELFRKNLIEETIVHYLNRLSDALFTLARWVRKKAGQKEILWDPQKS